MRLSDLQNKVVVNILDGKNIGNIIDVKINEDNGAIFSLIIEPNKSVFSVFNKNLETEIKWKNISKIGQDVILVNLTL